MADVSEYLTWLPDVLRDAGVDVYVMPGAATRTTRDSGLSPRGVVWHHTATGPNWQDGHVAALLRDGRRDLTGPLAQVGIERDGTWVIVALGRTNHNGYGEWGNDSIGLEFYNNGLGEPWPDVQVDSGVKGIAAIMRHLNLQPSTRLKGHRETDPRRKIDPTGIDMADIRRRVANYEGDDNVEQKDKDEIVLRTISGVISYFNDPELVASNNRSARVLFDLYDKAIKPSGGWANLKAHYDGDPEALAVAIAAKLSGAGQNVTQSMIETALKNVLGSLDE